MEPTTRGFDEALKLGNEGEVKVAEFLARNAGALSERLNARLNSILVKLDERKKQAPFSRRVNNVRIDYRPAPKSEQRVGDLAVYAGDETRNVEVKTETYALVLEGKADFRKRETRNIAFETHDVVRPRSYETLWAKGKLDRRGLLIHPPTEILFSTPTQPEWYEVPGGHLKTQADWLVHFFENSGRCVVLSLNNLKGDLQRGRYDAAEWFATCTKLRGKGGHDSCRTAGSPNINYYTVGKKMDVAELVKRRRAVLLP